MGKDDKILIYDGITRLDLPVDRLLSAAKKANMSDVLILGFDEDGEFYFASSKADGGHILWLMEVAKKKLLEVEI